MVRSTSRVAPGDVRPDAYIASYGLATPPHVSTEHLARNWAELQRRAGKDEATIVKQNKFMLATGVTPRPLSLACFHEGSESAKEMFLGKPVGEASPIEKLEAGKSVLTAEQRAALWEVIAPALCEQAARQAPDNWRGGSASDITHIVLTNTSGWREPGLAAHLINSLGLPLNTAKAELNFNGCFAGMTCLRLARAIVRAGGDVSEERARAVLVVGVEVASLHGDFSAEDGGSLVAHSLFSDGAGAFVVAAAGAWRIAAAGMELIPGSAHLLGMHPHSPPGENPPRQSFEMTLDRGVPDALSGFFAPGMGGNQLLLKVLGGRGVKNTALAVNPGGPRILDALAAPLGSLGFAKSALGLSYETLQKHGNLGSTAILFVLASVFARATEDRVVSLAFGPGVTVEWGAFVRA